MTACPRPTWVSTAIALPIVPLGTKRAASFPARSAANSCRRLIVGSSPYTSSPTSARYIAAFISGEGRVTVSLLRSINMFDTFLSICVIVSSLPAQAHPAIQVSHFRLLHPHRGHCPLVNFHPGPHSPREVSGELQQ